MMASGYKPFWNGGKLTFQKTGMVIITTKPAGANVYMDGKYTKQQTIFTFLSVTVKNLKPGNHILKIVKAGYQPWQEKVAVKASLVTFENYVLLFQNKLVPQENKSLEKYTEVAASPNNKYVLFSAVDSSADTNLYLYDTSARSIRKIWPTNKIQSAAWLQNPQVVSASFSNDNNKILLTLKNGTVNNYAVLDISGNQPVYAYVINQSELLNSKIVWNPQNSNELMALNNGNLYRITLGAAGLVSDNLIENEVVDFAIEANGYVYFVVNNKSDYALDKMLTNGNNETVIASPVDKSSSYTFAYSIQRDIIAVLPSDTKSLNAYYKLNNQSSTLLLANNIDNMVWSKDGNYLVFYNKNGAKLFDWSKTKETEINGLSNITSMEWYYDNNHFLVDQAGNLSVIDVDGSNKINIDSNVSNHWLYGLSSIFYSKTNGGIQYYYNLSINF
jgi:hypothetical protein